MSLDVYLKVTKPVNVFELNITHNLTTMARECGLYECIWHPEELGIKKARELVPYLKKGLELLVKKPNKFKKFNPENGWGSYDGLVEFVKKYIAGCEDYPDSDIGTCS